jgi:hypothetical protein
MASQAPTVRGFRLGMSLADVKARRDIWSLSLDNAPDETGFVEVKFDAAQLLSPKDRENVSAVQVEFLDAHVVTIQVRYGSDIKWRSIDEFASALSKSFDLPAAWQTRDAELKSIAVSSQTQVSARTLTCGEVGFAGLFVADNPVFILYRTNTKAIRDQRRAESQERARRAFKPQL